MILDRTIKLCMLVNTLYFSTREKEKMEKDMKEMRSKRDVKLISGYTDVSKIRTTNRQTSPILGSYKALPARVDHFI